MKYLLVSASFIYLYIFSLTFMNLIEDCLCFGLLDGQEKHRKLSLWTLGHCDEHHF